ncbi:MAG: NAD+ synthase [Desulfuromonas sp.]|nr:MAG: NAD+ synthase [Desulfuromonas sp.]
MRIAVAQLNYTIGDIAGNAEKIMTVIGTHKGAVDLIVFTELALTGYYPQDLIFSKPVRNAQATALRQIAEATAGARAAVVIGCATENPFAGKPFQNSLKIFADGVETFAYAKKLLPTYNIFEEARHFSPGQQQGVWIYKGLKLGFLICEDGWGLAENNLYAANPVDELKNQQVDLVLSINASPSNLGKQTERRKVFKEVALVCRAPLVYANQVGGNDEIVFDGASFALNKYGEQVGLMPSFAEAVGMLEYDQNAGEEFKKGQFVKAEGFDNAELSVDAELLARQAMTGLRDYVEKLGMKGVVVGSSGGIDSAVTLALAAKALGPDRVKAVTMPSKYSSQGSIADSVELCNNLDIELFTRPIKQDFDLAVEQFGSAFGEPPSGLAQENIQARIRGRVLMEYSNHTGYLVLSTGNKSEIAVGYATLFGDMNGGVNAIGDFYKTEVFKVAKWFNQQYPETPIPEAIITKPPSAELAPGQVDTDSLPAYDVLDAILRVYLEADLLTDTERDLQIMTLRGAAEETIEEVCRMVDRAEFKRRQAPPIIRVQKRSFGSGRHLPIVANYPEINKLSDLSLMLR